jgi:hypothetical protein
MSINLIMPARGRTQRTRFVLVNNRIPRAGEHCALCGAVVEYGYVRDSQTRLIYCDTQCFTGGTYRGILVTKNYTRKVS